MWYTLPSVHSFMCSLLHMFILLVPYSATWNSCIVVWYLPPVMFKVWVPSMGEMSNDSRKHWHKLLLKWTASQMPFWKHWATHWTALQRRLADRFSSDSIMLFGTWFLETEPIIFVADFKAETLIDITCVKRYIKAGKTRTRAHTQAQTPASAHVHARSHAPTSL